MKKSEGCTVALRKAGPVGPRFLQQSKGSYHIRTHEIVRPMDRTIHVAFGCEVVLAAECESNPCSNLLARAQLRLPAFSENGNRTDRPERWSIREAATIQLLSLPA